MTARVGDPSAPRLAVVVHGILGAGRNWRGVARALTQRHPEWQFLLLDLRNHAEGPRPQPPHTVAACGEDLEQLAAEVGRPELVVGHSFGGKVVLSWAERFAGPATRAVQVLDCAPGREPVGADTLGVLDAVIACPVPVRDRSEVRAFLRERGIPDGVVAWLATSLVEDETGWRWGYALPGVVEMITDFFEQDFWPYLSTRTEPTGCRIRCLRGGRSDRWTHEQQARIAALPVGSPVSLTVLSDAGHWLHVDDPEGVMRWMAEDLT